MCCKGVRVSRLELTIPPDVVWLVTAALMWLLSAVTPGIAVPVAIRAVLAGLFICCGVALIVRVRVELNRAHTTWRPGDPGRTTSLVTSGVFSRSRNPMYLGMWLVLVGWGVALASPLALAATIGFVLYLTRFQVVPEERALSAMLKEQYRQYATHVRRWI